MNPATRKILLAGDIGGTKTLLQLSEIVDGSRCVLLEKHFDSASYASLKQILAEFMRGLTAGSLHAACFGVAGPVVGNQACITNLPWLIEGAVIGAEFHIPHVRLINDFQAVAYGIDALEAGDLAVLQAGQSVTRGVRAVIGAGTGLGEGFMVWQGNYEAMPSEGSHTDFAPVGALQTRLLDYLASRYGHVSYERLVSGPGLVNIYEFLRDSERTVPESPELRQAMNQDDPAAAISQFALERRDRLASEALDLFVSVYGAETGNLALKVLARGGVYVAGGIAPKILGKLEDGSFMRAFVDKGRFAELLSSIPVYVVLNPKVGLLGAARVASGM